VGGTVGAGDRDYSWVFSKKAMELGKGCMGYVVCVLYGVENVLERGESGVLV
jgi:hypothetical protein